MTAGWLVACDLDQTLIFSRRAFRLPDGVVEPPVVVVEMLDGAPMSFATRRAVDGLATLAADAHLVPVTTRTLAQLARVDLGVPRRYAVAANGGHLLVDGRPDPAWAAAVADRLAAAGAPLPAVLAVAERLAAAAGGWARVVRVADDLFVYLVAYDRAGIPDLGAVAAEVAGLGWRLSVQGRKVYLVPAALTKEAAVAEVAARLGTARLAAAGDAVLDQGLLAAAEVAVRPAHGELHDQGWTAGHLRVTDRAGLLGGEDVVAELIAAIIGVSLAP